MKTVPSALQTHLAGETTTTARLVKITRADGQVFGFTTHDRRLVVGGVNYEPNTAVNPSQIVSSSSLSIDSLDIAGALDSQAITEADLDAGLWDGAEFVMYEVNWASLSDGVVTLKRGELGRVRRAGSGFVAELLGLMVRMQRTIGRSLLPTCDVKELGDARCGASLSAFTDTGTVTAVASRTQFTDSSLAQAAGYFRRGTIAWDTGANAGLRFNIAEHATGGVVTLDIDAPYAIAVGDTFTIVAGCDRTFATCRDTFDNVLNFRGFPNVPGRDKLIGEAVA